MIKIVRLGVEREVQDEHSLQPFLDLGYEIVEQQQENNQSNIYELTTIADEKGLDTLTIAQLKVIAKELEIEFDSKIKKEELINLIKENEGEE